jgi:hypothetical protein
MLTIFLLISLEMEDKFLLFLFNFIYPWEQILLFPTSSKYFFFQLNLSKPIYSYLICTLIYISK